MRQWIILCLFAFMALISCTNDETDEGLETLTPNEPTENVLGRENLV